jgi:hypothetical protein
MKTPLSNLFLILLIIALCNFEKSAGHTADKKGKILVLADGLGTHYSFAVFSISYIFSH